MIEAIACGTPVLAFHRGSVSEIVDEGTTGSIVDTVDEAVTALLALDRRAVRRRFEERFSANCIAGNYVDIYQSLLTRSAHGDVDGRKIVMPTERHMGIPGRPGIALAGSAMRQSENGIADKRAMMKTVQRETDLQVAEILALVACWLIRSAFASGDLGGFIVIFAGLSCLAVVGHSRAEKADDRSGSRGSRLIRIAMHQCQLGLAQRPHR